MDNEIIIYNQPETNKPIELELDKNNETIIANQEQIANLFGVKRPAITKHIASLRKKPNFGSVSSFK